MKYRALIFSFLLLSLNISFAQEAQPTDQSAQNITQQLSIIGGYTLNYVQPESDADKAHSNLYLFTKSPSYGDSLYASLIFNALLQKQTDPILAVDQTLFSLATISGSEAQNAPQEAFSTQTAFAPLNKLPILFTYNTTSQSFEGDIVGSVSPNPESVNPQQMQKAIASASNYNVNALIGTMQYKTDARGNSIDEQNAQGFIKYMTDQYSPTQTIDFSQLYKTADDKNKVINALNNSSVMSYLIALRKYAASLSVGLSNFDYLYRERKAYPTQELMGNQATTFAGIAQDVQLPPDLQQEASPLGIDQWAATRRFLWQNDATGTNGQTNWFDKIQKATPATLQRENLMLLAEIRYELFQIRMVNERILATLSTSQLQDIQQQKIAINTLIRNACNSVSALKDSGACPAAGTSEEGAQAAQAVVGTPGGGGQ